MYVTAYNNNNTIRPPLDRGMRVKLLDVFPSFRQPIISIIITVRGRTAGFFFKVFYFLYNTVGNIMIIIIIIWRSTRRRWEDGGGGGGGVGVREYIGRNNIFLLSTLGGGTIIAELR